VTTSSPSPLSWTDLDRRAVDTARVLAMDAVQRAGNGHPGTAMSLAPAAYLLFQQVMRHDPSDPQWPGRDRFVLSAGHASLTLYVQLYLSGYGLELADLRALRQWGSRTPGHPEQGHPAGVETTTGPLGQGLANAVGMAMAARRERGLLDPDVPAGASPFDHHIWVIASDGDIQEGISHEASALAGHQRLGNLVVVYDDNQISIEGDTRIALSEDVPARYAAYGWHVQTVDWRPGPAGSGRYQEDVPALHRALLAARAETGRPSFIALRTIIGWPAPTRQNTLQAHGNALGAEEVAATKRILGFDPAVDFPADDEVLDHARAVRDRGKQAHADWQDLYHAWAAAHPQGLALHQRLATRTLPEGWTDRLPAFPASADGKPASMATRAASGKVLDALAGVLPELWGGSADLAGSNNTTMTGEPSFVPAELATTLFPGHPYGRILHFGVREHAMGAILNGIALHGGTRPYGGTFLVFSDYQRPAVRLAALMRLPVVYVWTHDSVGLGEDGPTHQPVEHLSALRAIPGLDVVRPSDANETVWAWRMALTHTDRPTALCLTRQPLPVLDRSTLAGADQSARGGYVLAEAGSGAPAVILIGTGSEVALCLAARERLEADRIPTRVVAMPCQEWFRAQPPDYREAVLPGPVRARVSVEAAVAMSWRDLVGDAGECVSLEHYGASAPYQVIFERFGFTAEAVVAAARQSIRRARADAGARQEGSGSDE
jgi:transketolase